MQEQDEITRQPVATAISVTITRADGTVEDLGVVAFTAKDPQRQSRYATLRTLGKRIHLAEMFRPGDS